MWIRIWDYSFGLYQAIPSFVYIGIIVAFCLGSILSLSLYGVKEGARLSEILLLIEYVSLIFLSTVIFRTSEIGFQHDFTPFWSYRAVYEGNLGVAPEIILNIVVYIPLGFLLGCVLSRKKFGTACLIGLTISVMIELLQLIMKRGLAEFDDVFNNMLGCIFGYGIYSLISLGCEKFSKMCFDA